MARTVAIGKQNFADVIERNYFYVDKTDFITEWWENGGDVTLITRPRRFGKTLTISMMEYFFSIRYAGRSDLFERLKIWRQESYRELQGTYPVITLSFANVKADNYAETRLRICQLITDVYLQNKFLMEGDFLAPQEKEYFNSITDTMPDITATLAISRLSVYLSRYYNKKVIVLLDEYDTPMQEAYINGYWDQLAVFMRKFMNETFKTNFYLERAVMTGITRVSKESVFFDLNNLEVITTTSEKYCTSFGFTEPEVFCALEEYSLTGQKENAARWYDGYTFGSCSHIYNPWSVINFLAKRKFAPYWANTSSNLLVKTLLYKRSRKFKTAMEDLLYERTVETDFNEEITFKQLDGSENATWSLLLASGYLTIVNMQRMSSRKTVYHLSIPNEETLVVFDDIVTECFSLDNYGYSDFISALLSDDKAFMNQYLNAVAAETFSYFDTGSQLSESSQPERFYHGFLLGLLAELRGRYHLTSNRESGNGRYDVLLEPCDPQSDVGIIIEFKVLNPDTEKNLKDTAKKAIQQILDRKYATALTARGISEKRIRIYGFAFRGKDVFIAGGPL